MIRWGALHAVAQLSWIWLRRSVGSYTKAEAIEAAGAALAYRQPAMAKMLQCAVAGDDLTDEEKMVVEKLLDRVPCREDQLPIDDLGETRGRLKGLSKTGTVAGLEEGAPPDCAGLACLVFFCSAGDRELAVKVPRRGITEVLRRSMEDATWLLKAGTIIPTLRKVDLEDYLVFNREPILGQADMAREAQNLEAMRATLGSLNWVRIPHLYRDLCTPSVLAMERVHGKRMHELEGHERDPFARLLVQLQIQMWLVDGLYHGDPHPGNILFSCDEDGNHRLTLLDFGIVCRLSEAEQNAFSECMSAFAHFAGPLRSKALANAVAKHGCTPGPTAESLGTLRKAVRSTLGEILGEDGLGTVDGMDCLRIARVCYDHGYEPLTTVFRSIAAFGTIQSMVAYLVGEARACELGTIVYLETFGGHLLADLMGDGDIPISSSDEDE